MGWGSVPDCPAAPLGRDETTPCRPGRKTVPGTGLLATCLQHEIDHLNGVLFIDRISKLKRDRVIKKFQNAAKLGNL